MEIVIVLLVSLFLIGFFIFKKALKREKVDKMEAQRRKMTASRILHSSWSPGYQKMKKKW